MASPSRTPRSSSTIATRIGLTVSMTRSISCGDITATGSEGTEHEHAMSIFDKVQLVVNDRQTKVRRTSFDRQIQSQTRPFARRGRDFYAASQLRSPLTHVWQSVSAARFAALFTRSLRTETTTVVLNFGNHMAPRQTNRQRNRRCAGAMTSDVIDAFFENQE